MNGYVVLKGASYTLAVTPNVVIHNGITQTTKMTVNPELEYLKEPPNHLRSLENVVSYIPNQVYIDNEKPQRMAEVEFPWYDKLMDGASKDDKYGEIIPKNKSYGLIQIYDIFDLVKLEKGFAADVKAKLDARRMFTNEHVAIPNENSETTQEEITALINDKHTEPLYFNNALVGVVKRAYGVDVNLSTHIILESLATKASNILSLLSLIKKAGVDPADIGYVIDYHKGTCGDINQRGGGNFVKTAAEVAGFVNVIGSDVRGFCVGPVHVMFHVAALVKTGTFKNVVVAAGGCIAKLGANGKDHVEKGFPILEDAIAGLPVLVSTDDSVNPQTRTDIIGRHTIGTGSTPQDVISPPVANPLDETGLKITDIDKYFPEMQSPDVIKPVGADDVPEANYKMVVTLSVKRGELQRNEIADFVKEHGMTGWVPTQGHIPLGVPYLELLGDEILAGGTGRVVIIGKGSLSLGRMTNLFDGVSFMVQANDGSASEGSGGVDENRVRAMIGQVMRAFVQDLMGEEG